VIPSSGRTSLSRTLASVAREVAPGDEILVLVNDAWDWGNSGRQEGQEKAKGDYVVFCDDDDVFLPGSFDAMREWARRHPGRIGVFRRKSDAWPTQWQTPELRPGNVQSSNFLVPNLPGKLGRWRHQSQDRAKQAELKAAGLIDWSDAEYLQETARLQATEPIFVDVVTVFADPEERLAQRVRYRIAARTRVRRLLRRAIGGGG
jgi:glycosyltransferase involved in cell wall biosynthesis